MPETVGTLCADTHPGSYTGQDAYTGRLIPTTAHTLRAEGFDASEDGTGRGTPLVPVSVALRGREGGAAAEVGDDLAFTLRASEGGGDKPHVLAPVPFDTTQITSAANYSNPKPGDPCHPLAAGMHPPAIAFMADDYKTGAFSEVDVAGPLTTTADRTRGAPIAFSSKDYGADAGEIAPTLRAMGHDGSHANGGGQVAVAVDCYNHAISGDCAGSLTTTGGPPRSGPGVMQGMAVRRLTPVECERLQGFPDNYTLIPWRGKPAELCPDGPRYKALGNSWAVPCVRWIGERIQKHIQSMRKAA